MDSMDQWISLDRKNLMPHTITWLMDFLLVQKGVQGPIGKDGPAGFPQSKARLATRSLWQRRGVNGKFIKYAWGMLVPGLFWRLISRTTICTNVSLRSPQRHSSLPSKESQLEGFNQSVKFRSEYRWSRHFISSPQNTDFYRFLFFGG